MDNTSNLLDIIIVNYNTTDYLSACLRSVYDSLGDIPAQVLVQDNGSFDDVDRVSAAFPEVLISKNRYNMGFAKAVNRALKQGSAPYVVLLNPDTYIVDGFFESSLNYMKENPNVGVLGPKILSRDGSVQGSARSFPTLLSGLFGRACLLSKWFPNNHMTHKNVLTFRSNGVNPKDVDWVSGACMLIRREAMRDGYPMDERFFVYWEDADLCKRTWNSGWRVVYFPKASVVHYVGGSSDKHIIRSVFEFHKSAYRLFEKYAKSLTLIAKPLAVSALAMRLLFVLFVHGVRRWMRK
jgi:GT2 family glycosyltransferase